MLTTCFQTGLITFAVSQLFFQVLSQYIVGYTGNTTTIDCPLPENITHPDWFGPPNFTKYYQGGRGVFNPRLEEKLERLSIANNNKSLVITNISLQNDTGTYRCVQNVNGTVTRIHSTLIVRTLPGDPIFATSASIDSNGVRAIQDKSLRVNCTSRGGNPKPTVALSKDNVTLATINNGVKIGDTYIVELSHSFRPTREDDGKQLICRSFYPETQETLNSQTTNATLYLYLKPLQTTVSQTADVATGDDVTVECRSSGSRPAANISWTYSTPNYTFYTRETNNSVVSLFRRRVGAADNGQRVQCTVTHMETATDLTISTLLNVHFPVAQSSTHITGNSKIEANGKNELRLNCTTGSSNPASNITWKNGTDGIGNNDECSEIGGENNGYIRSQVLTLRPTRYEDRDNISCSVFNEVLQVTDTKSVVLDLRYHPIVFITTAARIIIPEENTPRTTELPCRVESNPPSTITWYHNNQSIASEKGSSLPYTITTANRTSYGTYTCAAVNGYAPNGKKSYSVEIQFQPLDVTLHKPPSVIANGLNPMSITCTSGTSNPVSSITWTTGVIQTSLPILNATLGEYGGMKRISTINFIPTREHDGLTISCEARNNMTGQHGASNSTVIDNIKYAANIFPISDMNATERGMATLTCRASSNPVAAFTWRRGMQLLQSGNGTVGHNELDYTINPVNRSHTGMYTCTADNLIDTFDSKTIKFTVQYPPDITVTATNTTVDSPSVTVTCNATGVPDLYTYERWVHTWWNGEVLEHPEPLPKDRMLKLTNLSYTYSGIYKCGASNGVNQVFSYGSGSLLVKSFPVIVWEEGQTMEIKTSGQLFQPIDVDFKYYSNTDKAAINVYRLNSTTENEVDVDISVIEMQLKLLIFKTEVSASGMKATIIFNMTEQSQFGKYVISVTNELGMANLSLVITPLGPPEPPSDITVTVLSHQSVTLTWNSGFPNGLNQTFIIQLSQDNIVWKNVTKYNGSMSFPQTHSTEIHNLVGNKFYYVRMVSVNKKGESKPTSVSTFTTKALPDAGTSIGLIAGGAAGGGVFALCVIAVVIFLIRRRNGNKFFGKAKDKGALVESRENVGFDDRDETVENAFYVSAGPVQRETALTASSSKQTPTYNDGKDIYAQVNKKPEVVYAMPFKKGKKPDNSQKQQSTIIDKDVYALPDKSNLKGRKVEKQSKQVPEKAEKGGKKKKGKQNKANVQTGDIYENSPSPVNVNVSKASSGDGVYEDTTIGASLMAQKPTRADGLLYADLEFKSPPKGKDPNKIIGIEDRCEYTTIDLTKKAKPLPDSDDESRDKS